jgi:hypothetical protein
MMESVKAANSRAEKRNMEKQNVERNLAGRVGQWPARRVGQGLVSGTLVLMAGLAVAALCCLSSKAPHRVHGPAARLVWYVSDGRLKADMHTLAAMVEFIMTNDSETPAASGTDNPPVARNAVTSTPRS